MEKIPTAVEFLRNMKCVEDYEDKFSQVSKEVLIEFAKLHVTEALKQAEEIAIDFDCEGNYDNSILNCYSLKKIK